MMRLRHVRRLAALSTAQWMLLIEALSALALCSALIRLVPFRWTVRWAQWLGERRERAWRPAIVVDIRWALGVWRGRLPWRVMCFQQGLAAHTMLRRRGIPSVLHYGVSQRDAALTAHVWVTLDGEIVVGAGAAADYRCLATFPAQRGCRPGA